MVAGYFGSSQTYQMNRKACFESYLFHSSLPIPHAAKEVAEMVAFIEQWLYVVMPTTHRMNPKDLAKTTLDIGPKKCSVPVEAMRMESPPYCAQD